MAITVKHPIGSRVYYISGTIIYSGIFCGWEDYGNTCIFFQIEPMRKLVVSPAPGRFGIYSCDVVSAEKLFPTAEDAVDDFLAEKKKELDKAQQELIAQEREENNHFGGHQSQEKLDNL